MHQCSCMYYSITDIKEAPRLQSDVFGSDCLRSSAGRFHIVLYRVMKPLDSPHGTVLPTPSCDDACFDHAAVRYDEPRSDCRKVPFLR